MLLKFIVSVYFYLNLTTRKFKITFSLKGAGLKNGPKRVESGGWKTPSKRSCADNEDRLGLGTLGVEWSRGTVPVRQ